MIKLQQELREWVILLIIALLVVVPVRIFALDNRTVPTGSMIPTIQPGDRLFIDKVSYHFQSLERGDIVVFSPPAESGLKDDLIKRLIALPGDSVEIKNGQLYVNDLPQEEPYLSEPIKYSLAKTVLPAGKIFVLGDNRNNSFDSHMWGFAEMKSVQGKALWRYWPIRRMTTW